MAHDVHPTCPLRIGPSPAAALVGDPDAGLRPTLFLHKRCARLIESIANLQHDPSRPEDVLKVDTDEEGIGGNETADALRYLVATRSNGIHVVKLTGL